LITLLLVVPALGFAQQEEYTFVYDVPSECEFISYAIGFGETPDEAERKMIISAKEDSEGENAPVANTLYFGWPGIDPEEEKFVEMIFNMGPDHHPESELDYQSKGALYLCP